MAWMLSNPAVIGAIAGARNEEQTEVAGCRAEDIVVIEGMSQAAILCGQVLRDFRDVDSKSVIILSKPKCLKKAQIESTSPIGVMCSGARGNTDRMKIKKV